MLRAASSATAAQVASALLSNAAPQSEDIAATAGTQAMASRGDHKHARLSSATVQTLGANGEVAITFTRTYPAMPAVICLLYEAANNQPVVFKLKSWTQDGQNNYTGCIIKGYRASTLPDLSGITLITGLVSALSNFNIFAAPAVGAQFCCVAMLPSN